MSAPRLILVTLHYLQSDRRAGAHWVADAFVRAGWEVIFVTGALSHLSRLRRDFRFAYPVRAQAGKVRWVGDRLASFVWYTPWHPANLRSARLNRWSAPLFRRYARFPLGELEPLVAGADLLLFESTPALLLAPRLRRLAPRARLVYRMADDLTLLRNHPVVLEAEADLMRCADLVSVPTAALLKRFPPVPNAAVQPHGVRRDLFEAPSEPPYGTGGPHAVFVGTSMLDTRFLEIAAEVRPAWTFHVIGPLHGVPAHPRIRTYGEMPFEQTVPYIRHADAGLQARLYEPGAESLVDSLKVMQYTCCRLPVIAPEFLVSARPNWVTYVPGDRASIGRALDAAQAMDRAALPPDGVWSWDDLARAIAGAPEPAPLLPAGAR